MKSFVGYVINKTIKAIPRSKKVSPTIKSVKPTKDVKGSVKRTKQDQYLKNIGDLNKARKKITEGKKMMKEGQKIRKQMTGTKRAFQFKNIKSYHAVEPGSKKIDPANIKQEKTKKFKTGKEIEKRNKSSKDFFETQVEKRNKASKKAFMGGGMVSRRMGYKKGSKKFPDLTGDGKVTFADILKGRGVINGKKKKKVI